jgi:CRISPR-associated protein Cas1
MRFYAFGVNPTHDNARALHQARVHASKKKREEVARRMFCMRFPQDEVEGKTLNELRSMEGHRIKTLYSELGRRYGVTWKGRSYDRDNWRLADHINRAISAANASLYSLCTAVVCSLGYLPQLGFIHSGGTIPFVYDIADIYKPETSLEAAFQAVSVEPQADEKSVLVLLKQRIEESRLLKRLPKDVEELLR